MSEEPGERDAHTSPMPGIPDGSGLEAVADAVLALSAATPGRGALAASVLGFLVADGGQDTGESFLGRANRMAIRYELLLAIADPDALRDLDWPRARLGAVLCVLMARAVSGGSAEATRVHSELDDLDREFGDDAAASRRIAVVRTFVAQSRAFHDGDGSHPAQMSAMVEQLIGILPMEGPDAGAVAAFLAAFGKLAAAQRDPVAMRIALTDLRAAAARLPEGHALRRAGGEAAALIGPLLGMLEGDVGDPTEMPPLSPAPGSGPEPDDDLAMLHHIMLGLKQDGASDIRKVSEAIEHLRAAVRADAPTKMVRILSLIELARLLEARSALTTTMADLDEAAQISRAARDLIGDHGDPLWSTVNDQLARIERRRGDTGARRFALDSLRSTAWQVLLQDGVEAAQRVVRDAAGTAVAAAMQALVEHDPADAVRALEGGRALMLFAATEFRDVAPRLAELGHAGLAEQWRAATSPTRPGGVGSMLAGLRREVLGALAEAPGLLDPPDLGEIAEALTALDADALVYLVAAGREPAGWAVTVSADGRPGSLMLPKLRLEGENAVQRFLGTVSGRTFAASAGQERGDRNVFPDGAGPTASLVDATCDWAWSAAMGPLIGQYLPTLPQPPAGRPHRIFLVAMGELALIPWAAARGDTGGYALEHVAVSQTASARMLYRSAAFAPVQPIPVGLVVGDPDTGDIGVPLVAARAEAEAVHRTFYREGLHVGRRTDGTVCRAGAGTVAELGDWLAPRTLANSCTWRATTSPEGTRPGALRTCFSPAAAGCRRGKCWTFWLSPPTAESASQSWLLAVRRGRSTATTSRTASVPLSSPAECDRCCRRCGPCRTGRRRS